MIVTHHGEGCFRFQSGETSLLVDPVAGRLKGDVVLRTIAPAHTAGSASHEILFPGEYEMRGMEIQGWPLREESAEKFLKAIYRVFWEDMTFAFLGHMSGIPDAALVEHLGEPDVLVLPVEDAHFLSVDAAAKIVKQLVPRYVLPSFAKDPRKLAKAFGQNAAPQDKLVFKKKDLAGIKEHIVILSAL